MQAYGVDYMTAAAAASRLLKNVKIRAFIEMLKNEKLNQMYFSADDLVQRYMDIAFADVGDVATFTEEGIQLRDNFDPTTVKSIKDTKYGYAIQMQDPFKAMEWWISILKSIQNILEGVNMTNLRCSGWSRRLQQSN